MESREENVIWPQWDNLNKDYQFVFAVSTQHLRQMSLNNEKTAEEYWNELSPKTRIEWADSPIVKKLKVIIGHLIDIGKSNAGICEQQNEALDYVHKLRGPNEAAYLRNRIPELARKSGPLQYLKSSAPGLFATKSIYFEILNHFQQIENKNFIRAGFSPN